LTHFPRNQASAEIQHIPVTETLELLDLDAERGLVDFAEAIRRLETTTFRKPVPLLHALLNKHKPR
jgi:hypothetical protein